MLKVISRVVGRAARSKFSRAFIPLYARCFKIDTKQAEKALRSYESLVEFFTRRLKPNLRPIASKENEIISPVDGRVAQLGKINASQLIQAKGINYSVIDLLGGNINKANKFYNGTYITIYLSPRDYHRIHMPYAGKITDSSYIPGQLFPVNALGVKGVKGLFAKNERLITYLDSSIGKIAVVKVGATIVGSVKVTYDPSAGTNIKNASITHKKIKNLALAKGEELGYFEFGSTVILLFEPGKIQLDSRLQPGTVVKMGEKIATAK